MSDTVVYENDAEPRVSPLVSMSLGDLVRTLLCGLGVGLIVALVYFLMNKFVFGAVLCRPQSAGNCSDAPMYAYIVAIVVGSIAGLVALVRMRTYRPLIAVIATAIALWGIYSAITNAAWYWALLATMVLFALSYALFVWIARIRSFILAIIVTIVLVIIIRLLFTL